MPRNKDRLYVALYARAGNPTMPGAEDTYHWALIVGPKVEPEGGQGMRYHAKERLIGQDQSQWIYQELSIRLVATQMLLVRMVIGKVTNMDRLIQALRGAPIVQGDKAWNCVIWVKNALKAIEDDGAAVGTSKLEWEVVRDAVMRYCRQKRDQHRFDGRGNFDTTVPSTYDLLEGREMIP